MVPFDPPFPSPPPTLLQGPESYRFRHSDAMLHRTHRHEPSVKGHVRFVGETDTLLAVSKPPSIPCHPR